MSYYSLLTVSVPIILTIFTGLIFWKLTKNVIISDKHLRIAKIFIVILSIYFFNAYQKLEIVQRSYMWWSMNNLQTRIANSIPIYNTLKKYDPKTVEYINTIFIDSIENNDANAFKVKFQTLMTELFVKHFPTASDSVVNLYVEYLINRMKHLIDINSDECLSDLSISYSGKHEEDLNTLDIIKHKQAIVYEIISSSLENNFHKPQPEICEQILGKLMKHVYAKFGDDVKYLHKLNEESIEKQTACNIWLHILEEIQTYPKEESGLIAKCLFSAE